MVPNTKRTSDPETDVAGNPIFVAWKGNQHEPIMRAAHRRGRQGVECYFASLAPPSQPLHPFVYKKGRRQAFFFALPSSSKTCPDFFFGVGAAHLVSLWLAVHYEVSRFVDVLRPFRLRRDGGSALSSSAPLF